MSFEQFAPAGGVADPFAPTGLPVEQMDTMQGLLAPDAEYFRPPLPFDNDILQSMQSLTDPSVWQDIALPGTCIEQLTVFEPYIFFTRRL